MLATSSAEHLWLLIETQSPKPGVMILHHALDMEGPNFTDSPDPQALPSMPQFLAAWGPQLWMIGRVSADAPDAGREVLTIRVEKLIGLETYTFSPRGRLELLTPLRESGELADVIGAPSGPVALIMPARSAQRSRTSSPSVADTTPRELRPNRLRLVQLQAREWRDLSVSIDLQPTLKWRLIAGGPTGKEIWLVGAELEPGSSRIASGSPGSRGAAETGRLRIVRQLGDGWETTEIPAILAGDDAQTEPGRNLNLRRLTRCGSQVLGIFDVLGSDDPSLLLAYLRPGTLLELTTLPEPAGQWAIAGMADGVRLIRRDRLKDELLMTQIDPVTGAESVEQVMQRQSRGLARVLHIPILVAVGLAVMVAVLILRPGQGQGEEAAARSGGMPRASARGETSLPATLAPMPPIPRLTALLIDMLPGAVLAVLILDGEVSQLLRLPLFAATTTEAMPSLLMIALTMLHSTASELWRATTMGKALMGGKVVRDDGAHPSAGQTLVRNLFKLVMLCIPPLALIVALNPNWKGIGDMLARTVVVSPRPSADSGSKSGS